MEKNILREVLIETRNLATNVTVVQLEAES
jgi:hypothetical protein